MHWDKPLTKVVQINRIIKGGENELCDQSRWTELCLSSCYNIYRLNQE